MSATFERELDLAMKAAREAGALLKNNFGKQQDVRYKGRIDLVTEMDHRSEELIIGRLGAAFPGDAFLAEERGRDSSKSDRVWIIDPLDGTVNYAHEYPVFSVSIALQAAGELVVGAVYNPLLDEMHAARRGGGAMLNGQKRRVTEVDTLERAMLATGFGYDVAAEPDPEKNNLGPFSRFIRRAQAVRRAGSAALAIAKVGVGRTDGFWERGLRPWDMAAGIVVVVEGGGRISNLAGGPPDVQGRQLVATNGRIHAAMLEVLAQGGTPSVPLPGGASGRI